MPRDYKSRGPKAPAKRATSKPRESTGSGFGTFLAGLMLGLVGGGAAVQFYHMRTAAPPAQTEMASQQEAPAPAPDESNRPRFEFYKLLPEMEVVVPEAEERAVMNAPARQQPTAPQPSKPANVAPADRYLLQVGAFKRHEDADRLKAQLALLGVEAQILRVEREGQVWHRVRVGPFEDRAELRAIRERLSGEGIESVLLKMAG